MIGNTHMIPAKHLKYVCVLGFLLSTTACDPQNQNSSFSQDQSELTPGQFQLVQGVEVPDLSGIEEGYQFIESDQGYFIFTINVSAENISKTFEQLASHVEAPGFLVLEIPTHEDVEKQIRKSESDPFHNDVFYLDGIDFNKAKAVIDPIEDLLINDGMIHFGFGSHAGHDEVFIGPYKVFTIFAEEPGKYVAALKELDIPKVESLKTVWDNFTEDTPGQRFALDDVETTIYEIVDGLKEDGLYFAERRVD